MIPLSATLARLVVGGLFIYAGALKIPEPALFAETIKAYDVLPVWAIHTFAVIVPWTEVVAGILLVVGFWTRSASVVSVGLLGAFAIAIDINLYRGEDFTCGCFGVDGGGGSLSAAAQRVALLVVLSCVVFLVDRSPFSVDRMLTHPESTNKGE